MATYQVPANDIGIEPMWIVNNRTMTNPISRTKTKLMLHSTATPGAPAQNFFNNWNKSSASASVEFVLDNEKILEYMPIGKNGVGCLKSWHCGDSGNNTHIATEVCEPTETQLIPINFYTQQQGGKYNRTYSIKRIQMELEYLGYYTGEIDGSFGPATKAAVQAFQKANGLSVDGAVGKTTLAKLAARDGSYCAYDVKSATPFFNAAYNNAVALFGFLCNYVGAKPSEIVCHSEGYKKGIASNHADVTHWFPLHGKSMDDFRADVQSYVDGTWVPLGSIPTVTVPSDEAYLTAIDQIADMAIINTPSYWEGLVENQTNPSMNSAHLFLQKAGQYFAGKNHVYAVDALVPSIGMNSPLYWQGNDFSYNNVTFLMKAIAGAGKGEEVTDYATACQICKEMGVLNELDYWTELSDDTLNNANVQTLLRNAAIYFIAQDWKYGVYALENAIGMTSLDYWLTSEEYSFTNWKFMATAIAANL